MNKQELQQMEKLWVKYHKSIPDFPISKRQQQINIWLNYAMAFLLGMLVILVIWLMLTVRVV